jgi:hypothetical protein
MNGFRQFFDRVDEGIMLRGSAKGGIFQRLVAGAYRTAPDATPDDIASYAHLIDAVSRHIERTGDDSYKFVQEFGPLMTRLAKVPGLPPEAARAFFDVFKKIGRQDTFLRNARKGFDFVPDPGDHYASSADLRKKMDAQWAAGQKKAKMFVYAEPPGPVGQPAQQGHPFLTNDRNVQVRGVHDAIAHLPKVLPFDARGEYRAYNTHLKTLCNLPDLRAGNCPAADILFTEIVAQTSHFYVYGAYPPQKGVILHDFDPFRVGMLRETSPLNKYFVFANKELVARPDFDQNSFGQEFPELAAELGRQEGDEVERVRQATFPPDKQRYVPLTPLAHTGARRSFSTLPSGTGAVRRFVAGRKPDLGYDADERGLPVARKISG